MLILFGIRKTQPCCIDTLGKWMSKFFLWSCGYVKWFQKPTPTLCPLEGHFRKQLVSQFFLGGSKSTLPSYPTPPLPLLSANAVADGLYACCHWRREWRGRRGTQLELNVMFAKHLGPMVSSKMQSVILCHTTSIRQHGTCWNCHSLAPS